MNEPITSISNQCHREVGTHFYVPEFAELIVRECYKLAHETRGIPDPVDDAALKEHFGVD